MYCKRCGKELPENSNYCQNCGANQKSPQLKWSLYIKTFYQKHKAISIIYLVWFFSHLSLYVFASPETKTYNRGIHDTYCSEGFYPYDTALRYLFDDGSCSHFSLIDNVNVYDFSEFFFYTILIPLIIYGIVKCIPYSIRLFNSIKQLWTRI